jgi:DNA polymerase delta subunit 1
VFNGLQLAYKVVANSVYGQAGARTSPIRNVYVAACTTSAGRRALQFARTVAEGEFGGDVVYGDTDSIFVKFPTKDVAESIRMGIECGTSISRQMRKPYKIAYEKTFYPFILFCRKRYVGMKYEEDPNPAKAKRMYMGIALKRRDSAPIVKEIYGGALDVLLHERNIKKAQAYVQEQLAKVLKNGYSLDKFIMSKALGDNYKIPDQMCHVVLAKRMIARDPGTAPKVGDRIQYVFVAEKSTEAKQGDRIEHIDYVLANKLHVDVNFYITNQIQNPVAQLFALCIEQLEGYLPPRKPYRAIYEEMLIKHKGNEEEATLSVLDKKADQLESIMFLKSPRFTGQPSIANFFKK